MAAHLRECAKLDRELRAAAQSRTIFDPEVRRLRAALRDQSEAALLDDLRLSQVRRRGRSVHAVCSMELGRHSSALSMWPSGSAALVAAALQKPLACTPPAQPSARRAGPTYQMEYPL